MTSIRIKSCRLILLVLASVVSAGSVLAAQIKVTEADWSSDDPGDHVELIEMTVSPAAQASLSLIHI